MHRWNYVVWPVLFFCLSASAADRKELFTEAPVSKTRAIGIENFPSTFQLTGAVHHYRIVKLDIEALLASTKNQENYEDSSEFPGQEILFTPIPGESYVLKTRIMHANKSNSGVYVHVVDSSGQQIGSGAISIHSNQECDAQIQIFSSSGSRVFKIRRLRNSTYHVVYELDQEAAFRARGKTPGYHDVDYRTKEQREADKQRWRERWNSPEFAEARAKREKFLKQYMEQQKQLEIESALEGVECPLNIGPRLC